MKVFFVNIKYKPTIPLRALILVGSNNLGSSK